MEAFTPFVPPLSSSARKGQAGRVGVIGGCLEYTGAPFFAGAAVLRLGGDLSHIFCAKAAAVPIKSYAPEQIVHPYLPDDGEVAGVDEAVQRVLRWAPSLHSFVIGPGLGRGAATLEFAEKMLLRLRELEKPVVVDGDALFLVAQKPEIVRECRRFVLTPNAGEFAALQRALGLPCEATCKDVARKLGGVTVFQKGAVDVVSDGASMRGFNFGASRRRVGGQGDITAGALALFAAWAPDNIFEAAEAASEAVRKAAVLAFEKKKRATVTTDILNQICNIFPDSWNRVVD